MVRYPCSLSSLFLILLLILLLHLRLSALFSFYLSSFSSGFSIVLPAPSLLLPSSSAAMFPPSYSPMEPCPSGPKKRAVSLETHRSDGCLPLGDLEISRCHSAFRDWPHARDAGGCREGARNKRTGHTLGAGAREAPRHLADDCDLAQTRAQTQISHHRNACAPQHNKHTYTVFRP